MKNIEVVLLRHEDDFAMNIFVTRIIGDGEKIKQAVYYVEHGPAGNPPIFPICHLNLHFDISWNDFYQKDGKTIDYKETYEKAVVRAEELAREAASRYMSRKYEEDKDADISLIDYLSQPPENQVNPNHRFWYKKVWFAEI